VLIANKTLHSGDYAHNLLLCLDSITRQIIMVYEKVY